jgi:hypothetical protein
MVLIAAIFVSCEKELDITEFSDDYGEYRSEIKVEALLQLDSPQNSIIRIIQTVTISDTEIFNGIDDDGDGDIDEEDEILPLIEDTTATVLVTNLRTGEVFDFQYTAAADSVVRLDSSKETIVFTYGGYKPVDSFQIEPFGTYKLSISSRKHDMVISGTTTVYPPVDFIDTLYEFTGNQVTIGVDEHKEVLWRSVKEVTAYYLTYEEVTATGEELLDSYPLAAVQDLSRLYPGTSVGREVLSGIDYEITMRLTIEALSPEWGRYVFSELPLKDPQRSNLRDENGNPVMGCFGSSAAATLLLVIEE